MALSNAERQARHRAKRAAELAALKAELAEARGSRPAKRKRTAKPVKASRQRA